MRLEDATSIRQKLRLVLLRASLVSLLLAGFGLMAVDLVRHGRATQHDLETQADVLALTSQAALSFQDPQTATEDLSSLRAKPTVVGAAIYDVHGGVFASYTAPGATSDLPPRVPGRRAHIGWRSIEVVRPIVVKQDRLGSIYIRGEHELLPRMLEYLGALAVILAASLGAGVVLTNRLQRSITEPITAISAVARQVLRGETQVRADKKSSDEVGELVDAFNAMLAELGQRAHRLEESNRAKDRFLATLAHELRNPLAPIRTGLEILKKDQGRTAASERARATMERQLVHMVHLIDDLLDIARVNTGKFKLELRQVDLRSLVDAAVEACRPGLDGSRHALALQFPDATVEVLVDPVRITQAVSNLLSNAAKYTPAGGRIALRVEVDQHIRISVQDNGIGIAPKALEQVFELFAQIEHGQHRAQGLGIGLFLVRSVVAMHGGTVTAASAGEGQGACFTITLPPSVLVAVTPRALVPAPPGAAAPAGDAARRFLVVDDNTDAAGTLAALLEMLGHTVSVAHSGEEALALVPRFEPDIVVLDIGMPGMDGYEVARRLKRRTDLRRQPLLVAATGWGTDADRARAMAAGFDRHLTKPIEVGALEAIAQAGA
ncbi:hybrid sensor histidine kinase/response regulator [Ramlibacter sp.]|uniref:hybrid sensor histidine kinase/response regulator n=1 Tax=Ramlibacter sp. TaxID=1917967 RepID=UPI002C2D8538|nr:ATP-binding protein [Ramlibacter sp.]HWI84599.1 ATP-binding protein [Ramlibacter sp.]